MRDTNQIDELFRETITPYELTPSDKVWASLDKKLQQQASPAKGKTSKILLAASVAVVGTTAFFVMYNNYNTPQKSTTNLIVTPVVKKAPVNTVQENNTTTVNGLSSLKNSTNKNSEHTFVLKNKSANEVISVNTAGNTSNVVIGKQEADSTLKVETMPTHSATKNNSDKTVLVLPYFPSVQTQNGAEQNNNQAQTNAATKAEANDALQKTDNVKNSNIVYVPNAFTPNGDGLNDLFIPQSAENLKEYKLYIFDRTGNTVFYSDELHRGWDGRSIVNGSEVIREDVYMWRIELKNSKGEKEHLMGYLNLIK
jgi:gliding motility-associated-like protein